MAFMIPREMMDWLMWARVIIRQSSLLRASDNGGIWLENIIILCAKISSSVLMAGEAMEAETDAGNSFYRIWQTKLE